MSVKTHKAEGKASDNAKVEYDPAAVALQMNAAKIIAVDKQPYLHQVVFAMVPVCTPGLGTFASDRKWRFYYDPVTAMEWDVEEVAGVILHEAGHCLRGHADRFETMGDNRVFAGIYNIAADSLINADLRDDGLSLPEGAVYVEKLKEEGYEVSREMSAEQIYAIIREKMEEEACTCGNNGTPQEGEGSEQGEGSGEGSEQGEGSGEGSQQGEGSGEGSQQGSGSGKTRNPNCPLHGDHDHRHGNGNGKDGRGNGIGVEGWDCGSAADGIRREYEKQGEDVDGGVDEERADVIRHNSAKAIEEHSKSRGNVPAGWERWAKEILEPVVDWRRELASMVRHKIATLQGIRDYTYKRPSRRGAAMREAGSGIILPAMRKPEPPSIAIVIDTSGSMSDDDLSWALSETKGILRGVGAAGRGVQVVSCDADAGDAQNIRNLADVKLAGGGGTDMRVGIEKAMRAKVRPEIIVVLSDGYTPWPDAPLQNTHLIVGLTRDGAQDQVPDWAKQFSITRE